ncbi:DUF1642 domain-containing protein [Enterococcus avium]|uniref:DUF1642 domain-containing protein n=1 Tax=Enterococcus avium TaxID=33945 RepID=UPI00288D29CA|nr:DUF1642 domain-containing protein [Enterococcus avium]MDT2429221.1 DUF1642 domain-containing protein [Enterococcus avium]
MNKQEVLEKLEQKKETILRSQKNLLMGSELWQVYEARAATFMSAINIVEQLNEPQKVKVPAYVAEWFEINKEQLEVAIWDLTTETYETDRDQLSEIQLWIKESDRPYKTLISMQDGYEVEEEPKFVVKQKDGFYIEGLAKIEGKTYAKTFDSEAEAYKWAELCSGMIEKV